MTKKDFLIWGYLIAMMLLVVLIVFEVMHIIVNLHSIQGHVTEILMDSVSAIINIILLIKFFYPRYRLARNS